MNTIISVLRHHVKNDPERVILKYRDNHIFKSVCWQALGNTVEELACALLDLNLKIGQNAAIFSENRPEWAYADLAILSCGALSVPIYATNTPKEIEYILNDSEAEFIFVSSKENQDKVLSVIKNTNIKRVISFEKARGADPLVMSLDELLLMGKKKSHLYKEALAKRAKAIGPDDPVTIIYTSGSSGPPKGVVLTNNNFLSNCMGSAERMKITSKDIYLSFLPLSHVFERMAGYYVYILQKGVICYAKSRDTILQDARSLSPTIMCGVPRFFEKLYAQILNKAIRSSFIKRNLFFWGYRVGRACFLRKTRKRPVPLYLSLQKALITSIISKPIKKLFGSKLRFFVSGGAPLSKNIAAFFFSLGIPILEGYGLTESSPVITVNAPDDYRIGTVGKPVSGVELMLAPDGEIIAKGPNIMKGYYRLYKDTESTVIDGWLHTGDTGYLDKNGYLVITGRIKDIIITSGGKNIAPSEIETIIKADRYIQDALVYGEGKKFITALIIPDFQNLKLYADFKKISFKDNTELAKISKIYDFIMRRIDICQKDLPSFARIKKFIILDKEMSQDGGELTPTLKIKRKIVTNKYKAMLDRLYEKDIM